MKRSEFTKPDKKFAKSISFYIKNLISKNKIYDIEFQGSVHVRKIYEDGIFYTAAPIRGDKIKKTSEFLKNVVYTAVSMDGFKKYNGPDVRELFQKKIFSEKELEKLKERKENDVSHITDDFLQKIESRKDLLRQFNKIT